MVGRKEQVGGREPEREGHLWCSEGPGVLGIFGTRVAKFTIGRCALGCLNLAASDSSPSQPGELCG